MKDKNKTILWLGIISTLIVAIIMLLLSWLNDSDYDQILLVIPYKWQLHTFLILILFLLFIIIYTKNFTIKNDVKVPEAKSEVECKDSKLPSAEEKIMENLSPAEASLLNKFIESKNKVIAVRYGPIVKVLIRNNVLRCLKYNNPPTLSEIVIEEWAWEWIHKNKSNLQAKL